MSQSGIDRDSNFLGCDAVSLDGAFVLKGQSVLEANLLHEIRADSCVSSDLDLYSGANWIQHRLEHRLSILVRPRKYQGIIWNRYKTATYPINHHTSDTLQSM